MDRDRLHQMLRQLDEELQRTTPVDATTRDLLRDLSRDIRSRLETAEPNDPPAVYQRLAQRLAGAAQHFEASHPALAKTTANLVDTLALFNL